ncbi:SNG1 family protein [Aspergillus undulatus]|uniref:SNG1 family protein n=1 Tax=Aspergillus undulatus TaxID=1810928 RepID=UPI003CCD6D5F
MYCAANQYSSSMAPLKPFLTGVVGAAISLQLLILANMSYLYGTAYHNSMRYSTMKVLYVDYDEGAIGQSVTIAYNQMKGPGLPTLLQRSPAEYPTEQEVQEDVCKGEYWGAIYSSPNASSRLSAALSSSENAQAYDNSQALRYVWSSARYPSTAEVVYSKLVQFTQGAASVYKQTTAAEALTTANISDPNIARTILDPVSASSIDLHPMPQGQRFYYNTVSMVMPIIIQFFFIMATNGISAATNILSTLSPRTNTALRFAISISYTFIASLVMAGYIWAFRENWTVSSGQFALSWMAIWLAMHVHNLLIDFATAIVPMQFMPFIILTWAIVNVSSTIAPFDLSPGFYRVGYALPAHPLYEILLQIWTHGCYPHLDKALSVLWCEWVVALCLFVYGMSRRTQSSLRTLFTQGRPGTGTSASASLAPSKV